jgi:hypothetical protein
MADCHFAIGPIPVQGKSLVKHTGQRAARAAKPKMAIFGRKIKNDLRLNLRLPRIDPLGTMPKTRARFW